MKVRYRILIFAALSLLGCRNAAGSFPLFTTGQSETDRNLRILMETLNGTETPEGRFILINRIAQILRGENRITLDLFLQHVSFLYPNDPFNAYYLFLRAQNCETLKNHGAAQIHYMRILKEYPELTLDGLSLFDRALERCLALTVGADARIDLYQTALPRIRIPENRSELYYRLAKAYEEKKEWSSALEAYEKFLESPHVVIHDDTNAYSSAAKKVGLSKFNRVDWAYDDLNRLVADIKYAIRTRNSRLLQRCQSQALFFANSWAQDEVEAENSFRFGMGTIIQRQNIRYAAALDPISNEREAYLETWNWQFQVGKWYFYFSKIDYPADPELNGKWEWAGIYFGDKHFESTADAS